LRKFKLILKDLVNGVPTAYNDLESLLTNGDKQLQKAFTHLPGFLQKLIEHLPDKFTESLAPEILAAASERARRSGLNMGNAGKAAGAAKKMGLKVPSLKEVVGKPAAIVGMLRSIAAFLRSRFPTLMGMNVLWTLALFSKRFPGLFPCSWVLIIESMSADHIKSSPHYPLVLPQTRSRSASRERAPSYRTRDCQT
jgi:hypothetical protein